MGDCQADAPARAGDNGPPVATGNPWPGLDRLGLVLPADTVTGLRALIPNGGGVLTPAPASASPAIARAARGILGPHDKINFRSFHSRFISRMLHLDYI